MGSGGARRPARAVRTGAGRSAGAGCHLVSWGAEVTERTAAGALGLRPWPPGLWLLDCGRGPHYGQGPQTAAGVPDCGRGPRLRLGPFLQESCSLCSPPSVFSKPCQETGLDHLVQCQLTN